MSDSDDAVATNEQVLTDNSLLATVRRALDAKCADRRRNVLIDAVLVAISRYESGCVSAAGIAAEIKKLFRSGRLPDALVARAISDAYAADLVTKSVSLFGDEEWMLTDAAKREVREDREWADLIVENLVRQAKQRLLDDIEYESIGEPRTPKVIESLRTALAIGCEGLYDVQTASTPETMRPINFNAQRALTYVRSLQPRSVRNTTERLLLAAMDPDDAFGDEYIHLLVACNVLHAMATRRDLPEAPSLAGMRVVLDTSALVDAASAGSPEALEVEQSIRLAVALGAQVVIPDHVLDEWRVLFDATEAEFNGTPPGFIGSYAAMAENPFVRAFGLSQEQHSELTWISFRHRWREPKRYFEDLGATIRPHHNDRDDSDKELVRDMAKEMRKLNRQRSGTQKLRAQESIMADAHSVAMVARWRRTGAPDSAFFVAPDRMSPRAYATIRPRDPLSITITRRAWLLFVATLTSDDPNQRSALAAVIGNSALRDSFFSLASCYNAKELAEFAETLRDDGESEPGDITAFVQQQLQRFEDDADDKMAASVAGGKVLQYRSMKRNLRARRAGQMRDAAIGEAVRDERDRQEVRLMAVEQRHATDYAMVDADRATATSERDMYRRLAAAFAGGLAYAVAVVVMLILDVVANGWWWGLLVASAVVGAVLAGVWVKSGTRKIIDGIFWSVGLPTAVTVIVGIFKKIKKI